MMAETEGEKIMAVWSSELRSAELSFLSQVEKLAAAAIDSALADRERATREACAKIAESLRTLDIGWEISQEGETSRHWPSTHGEKIAAAIRALGPVQPRQTLHIICKGEPPDARLIEIEDSSGHSINADEWRKRSDGYWELVIEGSVLPSHIIRAGKGEE